MKRKYLFIALFVILIYLINIFYYFKTYRQLTGLQENFILKQTQLAGTEIEKEGAQFENDLNNILFSKDITLFFSDEETRQFITSQLEIFYSKYGSLVNNIVYFNENREVFSLYRDKKNSFIADILTLHKQRSLVSKEITDFQNGEYLYYLPVFKNGLVAGNLVVSVDYLGYISSVFRKSRLEEIQWQWLIDKEGKVLFNNMSRTKNFNPGNIRKIKDDISSGTSGTLSHSAKINGQPTDLISAYYPVRLLNRDFGIVFTLKPDVLLKAFINNSIIILIFTTLLIGLVVFLYEMFFRDKKQQWEIIKKSEDELLSILESLPLGIIILDDKKTIYRINQTARNLFREKNLKEGKIIEDWFFTSTGKSNTFKNKNPEDQLLYYKSGIQEHVFIREEIPLKNNGKTFLLEALLDITPFEKARKQEAVAVKTKSEFLANMSHEIRTPLNGIIGLADNLKSGNLSEEQQGFLSGIKKSAGLLLSIVDDILMFSKIEAGEVFLEEISFDLKKELDLAVRLIRPKAKEKGLDFQLVVNENVITHLIGDPFKIRQIISHLGDNAVKFTKKGLIKISVEQLENKAGKIVLQFKIEDTGIGIPKDKLDSVFDSFRQTDSSLSRKFGGTGLGTTLSRQLVEMLRGEITVDSPSGLGKLPDMPGTRFTFTVELFSDERQEKKFTKDKITSFSHIKALIIKDNEVKGCDVLDVLKNFGVSCELNYYQSKTYNLIESNFHSQEDRFHIIVLRDSPSFDAFHLARMLYEKGITEHYLLLIISSNDKKGNNIRSRKLGVDYYLIEPCDGSEIFEILLENFPKIKLTKKSVPSIESLCKNIHILVAEDNLINQKVIKTFFKNLGYEIDVVENGVQVIKKIEDKDYDIIFMDLMMPEMDGWEATNKIRDKGINIPIVAITADVSDEARKKAKDKGLNDFITKPVKIEEIKRVLKNWFAGQK